MCTGLKPYQSHEADSEEDSEAADDAQKLNNRFWAIFVATLTLNFQGQISNWLYLIEKQEVTICPL